MRKHYRLSLIGFIFFTAALWGCNDEFDKYYDEPDWLLGTTIKTLEARGDCKIFLEGLRLTGFDSTINAGTSSVFAPTDEAFQAYFQKKGYSKLQDIPKSDLKNIIGYHLLKQPYSRYQLFHASVWGTWDEIGARCFKKQTMYQAPMTVAKHQGNNINVGSWPKFVPFFSDESLEDRRLEKDDYFYFYPQTKEWKGFHMGNAAVIEQEISTNNGYAYILDQVVEPLPAIEELMRDKKEYSMFYEVLQRFETYENRTETPMKIWDVDTIYEKSYGTLIPNVASELTEEYVHGKKNFGGEHINFAVYIPNNDAMQSYLNQTFLKDGITLDDVPKEALSFLVKAHIGGPEMPSAVKKNGFYNPFGESLPFDLDADVDFKIIASNGSFYGVNKVLVPNIFKSVGAELLFNPKYSLFMKALYLNGTFTTLSNSNSEYTVFALSNETMKAAGYSIGFDEDGNDVIKKKNKEGDYIALKPNELNKFVVSHFVFSNIKGNSENRILETSKGDNVQVKNGKVLLGGNIENSSFPSRIAGIEAEGSNGVVWEVDSELIPPSLDAAQVLEQDKDVDKFFELLKKARIVKLNRSDDTFFLNFSDKMSVFAPTNQVLESKQEWFNLAATLPKPSVKDCDLTDEQKKGIEKLAQELRYYFVNKRVFDVDTESGKYQTPRIDKASSDEYNEFYEYIEIESQNGKLTVIDHAGNRVEAKGNIFSKNGVIHKIESLLQPKKLTNQ
ncbi:MAG: fasciclin domain-containing protein [Cytophagales bacterium]|nr:fasciclin domain-containing protein [Cytophagales bacterium]